MPIFRFPCLGERAFYVMNFSSDIQTMKKLEFSPSCFHAYQNPSKLNLLLLNSTAKNDEQ